MARPPTELQAILKAIPGVKDAYLQPPKSMQYPCIRFERDDSDVTHADNLRYFWMKRYQVIVIDRDPDSQIPDLVEQLPYARFNRYYRADNLNHFVFQIFF